MFVECSEKKTFAECWEKLSKKLWKISQIDFYKVISVIL